MPDELVIVLREGPDGGGNPGWWVEYPDIGWWHYANRKEGEKAVIAWFKERRKKAVITMKRIEWHFR